MEQQPDRQPQQPALSESLPPGADHHRREHECRAEQRVQQPRAADERLGEGKHRAQQHEPVVDGCGLEDVEDGQE